MRSITLLCVSKFAIRDLKTKVQNAADTNV